MRKEKPHNDGEWTQARFRSFVMSALRKARWPCKYKAIKGAYKGDGINPATGRKCKLHECEHCKELFPAKDVQADHIEPIVPLTGFETWDQTIERLFCEIDGFQVLCKDCHKIKTDKERKIRQQHKKQLDQ